jgi:hypothetical protein
VSSSIEGVLGAAAAVVVALAVPEAVAVELELPELLLLEPHPAVRTTSAIVTRTPRIRSVRMFTFDMSYSSVR